MAARLPGPRFFPPRLGRWLGSAVIGRLGEHAAVRHLRRHGLRILARNARCGRGEIDILALDGEVLVFVEVKSRTERSYSRGLEKLDARKRRSLEQACRVALARLGRRGGPCRVDAVSVDFRLDRWFPRIRELRWHAGVLELD